MPGAILEVISGLLKFPGVILEFIRYYEKTPQELREGIMKKLQKEAEEFEKTGRPTW